MFRATSLSPAPLLRPPPCHAAEAPMHRAHSRCVASWSRW